MLRTRLTTGAPVPFDFDGTACSHGWVALSPNAWDAVGRRLLRTERLPSGRVVHLEAHGAGTTLAPRVAIDVLHHGALDDGAKSHVRLVIRRMFRLDEDLAPFHGLCRQFGGRWESAVHGLGRLLRSPTVFEDAVKTMCTTNVQWGGTKAMVARLVELLGEPGPDPDNRTRAFPTPDTVADADDETLGRTRLGYRAPFVRELSRRVCSGDLDLEALLDPHLPTDEVRRRLLGVKGFGAYAVSTMLMLLGRYDQVAVDSVYRTFVTQRYFGGQEPPPGELQSVYEAWGDWQYLGYWFDLLQEAQEGV